MRALRSLLLVLAILSAATACGDKNKTLQWREQTQLVSGKEIVVQRTNTYLSVYSGQNVGWLLQTSEVRAALPNSSKEVVWRGTGLSPLAIDAVDRAVFLVAAVATLKGRETYDLQRENHVAFKWTGPGESEWQRISVNEVPRSIRPNLLVGVGDLFFGPRKYDPDQTVALELKAEMASLPALDPALKGWPASRPQP